MADNKELNSDRTERKIPVFTVFKNNSILKNIFVIDSPPNPVDSGDKPIDREFEEVLLVGRHPDCNITLEHPSISRFHLRIHSKPSSQIISVVDLSSVHGTRVSGVKIEPGVQIQLNEGDSLQLGGSSRIYRLHWIPLSFAYDLEKPFLPPLDTLLDTEEREGEGDFQDDNHIETLADDLDNVNLLFSDENSKPQLENSVQKSVFEEDTENKDDLNQKTILSDDEVPLLLDTHLETENSSFIEMSQTPKPSFAEVENEPKSLLLETENVCKPENDDLRRSLIEEIVNLSPESKITCEKENPESLEQKSNCSSIWSRRGKPSSAIKIQTSRDNKSKKGAEIKIQKIGSPKALFTGFIEEEEEEIFTPDKENFTPNTLLQRAMKKKMDKSEGAKIKSPKVLFTGFVEEEEEEDDEIFTPNKENITPNTRLIRSMKKMDKNDQEIKPFTTFNGSSSAKSKPSTSKVLSSKDENGENINSNTLSLKSSIKKKCSKLRTPFAGENSDSSTFSKTKQTRTRFGSSMKLQDSKTQLAMDTTKSRIERVPFQSLLVDSIVKKKSEASDLLWKRNPVMRKWTMVVDTNCLIDKKSISSLRLLQGIKGTQLVVPRTVIRELDCMKRRASLFRRPSSEAAALALDWIEECMLTTNWWIRVQSLGEEERKIAETPPSSPQFSDVERFGFVGFPLTPLAEDHILECGLLFRKIINSEGGRLVLLTNDVTLKIKAMAEGLLCETVEEFRGSLVNPFSERFLWADSSPRGATWSCFDDVVLRKRYDCDHLTRKMTTRSSGEGGNGLKLILQYKV
ncbi:FHA domain-containing protein PS1 [Impatiens glandulifera]|uniref:FHA domain-containing protein PS1 n=1 Tax=Impatiens glandulifera TaxID=253017 RepID=UPI001FB0ADC8|nr:FHA domain-containing protein PS1 [Impatiens glandulifera]